MPPTTTAVAMAATEPMTRPVTTGVATGVATGVQMTPADLEARARAAAITVMAAAAVAAVATTLALAAATVVAMTAAVTTVGGRVATGPTTDPAEPTQPLQVLGRSPAAPAGEESAHPRVEPPAWITVGTPAEATRDQAPLGTRRVIVRLVAGILVVLIAVTIGGSLAARRLAEREAVNDSASIADVLAETVVQPALTDALFAGDEAALQSLDDLIRDRVLGDSVVRVKIWAPDGTVIYADQLDLVGRTFPLDPEEREVLREPRTVAEISDLDRAENALDREIGDKLVEVYRPVWTASGQEALFEIYTPYEIVSQRTGQLWRGFAGVTMSSLLLFVVLLAPLLWHLLSRARRDQRQRELLLERAVDASDAERRRIAATLHDGPVQDLAATSFVIAGATANAEARGRDGLADELRGVAGSVRTSIRALRTLLVDIYPPSLAQAGLAVALTDLAQTVRAPGLQVVIAPVSDTGLGLRPEQERLVYRVAQETLRNAAKHATPCTVRVSLERDGDEVVLDVADDGPGFDAEAALVDPEHGHFGLQLLAELATSGGGTLQVATAPGRGTRWRLRVHSAPAYDDERDGVR